MEISNGAYRPPFGGLFTSRGPKILIYLLVLLFPLLHGPAADSAGDEKAVAKVNGVVLTEIDLSEAMNELIPFAAFHGGVNPEQRERYRADAVELMIEKELLYQEAKLRGMKPEKGYVDKKKEDRIRRMGGKKAFKSALKQWGISEKEYEKMIEKRHLIDVISKSEIEEKATVSDEETKDYYDKHKSDYMRPEAYRLRHILISVSPNASSEDRQKRRALAEEVLGKAKSGTDFASLAWDYSNDPYRVKGGDLGLVHKGMLDPDIEKAVQGLGDGQISGIVQTIYGYHIVKLEKKSEPKQLKVEDVSAKIGKHLKENKAKEIKERLLSSLRKKAEIVVY